MQKIERARRGLNDFVRACKDNGMKIDEVRTVMYQFLGDTPASTPSSHWAADREADPHFGHYDKERAQLALGRLTDDELANAAFLHYDVRPPFQDVLDGKALMPIVYMTAVKERIRWLSRALDAALAAKTKL